jgi:hypothetical protein
MSTRIALGTGMALAAIAVAGCIAGQGEEPPDGRSVPPARDAANCLTGAQAVIRNAPASASDPATGAWLGRLDHLRDKARALGDTTSRDLAGELDYAGAKVAIEGFPPQLAIVPVWLTCTLGHVYREAAPASSIPATQAWLKASPPPTRPGMIAGIITQADFQWGACPSPSHGSAVATGAGCEAWSATLTTATGTLRVSCGNLATGSKCTSATAKDGTFPDPGDEIYVPRNGQVTGTSDVTIISQIPWGNWEAGIAALTKAAENPVGAQ